MDRKHGSGTYNQDAKFTFKIVLKIEFGLHSKVSKKIMSSKISVRLWQLKIHASMLSLTCTCYFVFVDP